MFFHPLSTFLFLISKIQTLEFVEMMNHLRSQNPDEVYAPWRVMIVDEHTKRIVSTVCSTEDVFSEGIARRSPSPSLSP
jgi:hypothetical protein